MTECLSSFSLVARTQMRKLSVNDALPASELLPSGFIGLLYLLIWSKSLKQWCIVESYQMPCPFANLLTKIFQISDFVFPLLYTSWDHTVLTDNMLFGMNQVRVTALVIWTRVSHWSPHNNNNNNSEYESVQEWLRLTQSFGEPRDDSSFEIKRSC